MSHADTITPTVREYKSRHDALADLPLITESAQVTAVTPMDRDRRDEVITTVEQWFTEEGISNEYVSLNDPETWNQLVTSLDEDGYTQMSRRVATLTERYQRPKPMLVRTELETEESLQYLAGQYIGLRYNNTSRAYSLASSPNQEKLEICVRRVPGGRLSPQLCENLDVSDRVTVRGPYGELVLQDRSPRDMVFLATGTGVAPFKGMIDYIFEEGFDEFQGSKRNVWLFLGAAWKDDLPYRDSFRDYHDDRDNFHFVPCLSREPILSDWDGETDYVQNALLKHINPGTVTTAIDRQVEEWIQRSPNSDTTARLEPSNMEVYACGINSMVYSLVTAVEQIGVPETYIESEGFG